jgi:hypothetical protein
MMFHKNREEIAYEIKIYPNWDAAPDPGAGSGGLRRYSR